MNILSGIHWFPFLLELLFKSTLALSLALLLITSFRKKSASLRHFILAIFLIGILIFPLFSILPFGWETNLLPSRDMAKIQENILLTPSHPDNRPQSDKFTIAGMDTEYSSDSIALLKTDSNAKILSRNDSLLHVGRIVKAGFVLVWAAGLCLLLLRLGLGLLSASRITREGKPVIDPVWRVLMDRFLSAIGLTRPIRLKSHDNVIVPLTWGLIKPVILIPSDHQSWSQDQKSSALFHELSHIKRADFLVTILVRLSLALFWFNPLSWIVFRQMKNEQEKACDEMVLKAGIKPSTYAANLLLFRGAAGLNWVPPTALLGMFSRSSFGERLTAILKQKLTFKEITMKTKLFFGAIIILTVAFIGTAQPTAAAPDMVANATISHSDAFSLLNTPEQTASLNQEAEQSIEAQEQTEQEQQKKQEKQTKQKEKQEQTKQEEIKKIRKIDKHTIVITGKDGSKEPIEITIISGDKKEIFKGAHTISIKKTDDGKVIILDDKGKELKVIEGKSFRLAIKEGNIELTGGDHFDLTEGNAILLGKDGEKDANIFIYSGKDGKTFTIDKKGNHGLVFKHEKGEKDFDIHIMTEKDANTWTAKNKSYNVYFSPDKTDKVVSWVSKEDSSEIKGNLKKLREELEKLKAEGADIAETLKSLEELEKKLKDHQGAHVEHIISDESPVVSYRFIKKGEGDETAKDLYFSQSESQKAVAFVSSEGDAQIVYSISGEGKSREVYEKTLARLKEELPDGAKLEPEFDEESGVIKLKISNLDSENFPKEFIKKLVEIIEEETKK